MRHLKYKRFEYLRSLALVSVAAFGLATIIATGGGGGDGDGNGEIEPVLRDIYNFLIASGFTGANGEPLTFSGTEDGQPVTLALSHPAGPAPGITGTFNTLTEEITVNTNTAMIVRDISAVQVINNFTLNVSQEVRFPSFPVASFATEGQVVITREGNPVPDPITITVIDDNPLNLTPDVRITVGMDPPEEFTWQDFEDLEDEPTATADQQFAAFAYGSLGFMLELMDFSVGALEAIADNEDALATGPVPMACTAFSSQGFSVPVRNPAIPDAGEVTLTWLDDNSTGSVDPGDGFEWSHADCWDGPAPIDLFDGLLNGTIETIGYTEVVNAGFIDIIGFEPFGNDPGGVIFNDFKQEEIDFGTTPPTLLEAATINGGFKISFSN